MHDHRAIRGERRLEVLAQDGDVVAVERAHVGEVQLLEQQPRRRVGLDRRLDLGADALDLPPEAERQLGQARLDLLAGVVQARVCAQALKRARERADVRRDRHAVVVEDDHDRGLQAAGVVQRLERHPAGERAVTDHRDDLAVLADPVAHRLLEPDGVADRGRGVAGAHDVVLRLEDRAERGEALVLANRLEPVAAPRQDLVRVGLVADVPEDLVPRRVEQRVEDGGELAGAEVGAKVAADLADRVDDQLAHLLRDLGELLVAQAGEIGRAGDRFQQAFFVAVGVHGGFLRILAAPGSVSGSAQAWRVWIKPAISSRSPVSPVASASDPSALRCDSAASSRARSRPYRLT